MDAKRKCSSCQKLINAGANFCNFCGQRQAPLTAKSTDWTQKKFLTAAELETLKNELLDKTPQEITALLEHTNKYLRRVALEIFWQKAGEIERRQAVAQHLANGNFAASLLDLQPDWADLFTELWLRASENPWLVHKYLSWAKKRNYALPPETVRYLESTTDLYLIQMN